MRRQRGTGGGRSRSGASGGPIGSGSGGAGAHPAAVGVSTGERASADLAALALATKPDSPNSVNIFPVRSPG